ncbi:SDR family NAD(P)-dependent oxidoreductase [Klebsiella pneumoniae subsp. pneumoniae]|nr:SDR family NAD(P)-dependent oxidoreductase [Klebsiella pneumoniae]MCS5884001.1 SDR family NAD(P)-dependent oxidoreductase [Klebsiella pneumoniae subsp. pneumoniae]HBW3196591.1 SDR family NAD(P)-dependent oxidoreductase [Klebsiella pneumoniae]
MLRGKRAVITGGGTGFGQALSVWLAREGVEVDFCARRADDIQKLAVSLRLKAEWRKGISVI